MPITKVLVFGDAAIDNNAYLGDRFHPAFAGRGTEVLETVGGAKLLGELIRGCHVGDETVRVETHVSARKEDGAYAVWSPCPRVGERHERAVWRVTGPLGYGPRSDWRPGPGDGAVAEGACDVCVIDDAGMGFRFAAHRWPSWVADPEVRPPDWVVVKMSHPVCGGDLWYELRARFLHDEARRSRFVTLVSAGDLRRGGAMISSDHSWEDTVSDLLVELESRETLKDLASCGHLVVTFGNDGALWVDGTGRASRRLLVFDPGRLEGDFAGDHVGRVPGGGTCLTAAVVRAVLAHVGRGDAPSAFDPTAGIARGLRASRTLLRQGHGDVSPDTAPAFPVESVTEAVRGEVRGGLDGFVACRVPEAARVADGNWSFLSTRCAYGDAPLYGKARLLARRGKKALKEIAPYGAYGSLFTVDRSELESFNGLRRLITDYAADPALKKPLCLGVFGPPGAGKSFGVKQIARGILGRGVPILEFNLSQFGAPDAEMLHGALHQVRDKVLEGEIPVVFWDEFDCNDLEWLQYLLSPMQDGSFLQGQIKHPIGRCVFVFAGGTRYTMRSFSEDRDAERFKRMKGPDFVSRLRGYLDVLGPNPRLLGRGEADDPWRPDPDDTSFPIRRVILMRGMLRAGDDEGLKIDPGLLSALIKIDAYAHGARSLETILSLTRRDAAGWLMKSGLPPKEHIDRQLDYDRLVELIREGELFEKECEKLAPHIHAFYRQAAKAKDWDFVYDMEYEDLPLSIQADNRAAARRIPEVLSLLGLRVVPEADGEPADATLIEAMIEENIEELAELEHEEWTRFKTSNGWRDVESRDDRDDDRKEHDCLIPYADLDKEMKERDRDAVRAYPEIVSLASHIIVFER